LQTRKNVALISWGLHLVPVKEKDSCGTQRKYRGAPKYRYQQGNAPERTSANSHKEAKPADSPSAGGDAFRMEKKRKEIGQILGVKKGGGIGRCAKRQTPSKSPPVKGEILRAKVPFL